YERDGEGMSSMRCACGGTISNIEVPCPTEGWLYGEQDNDRFREDVSARIAGFVAAVREGQRGEWVAETFGESYTRDSPDAEVIHGLILATEGAYALSVDEYPTCGRLHVQTEPGVNQYRGFAPDEPGYHRVLAPKLGQT
ncbi:MAG TPA: hypothetical protein VF170_17740, partial [Planctomycetaceae bacterium]